MQLLSKIQMTFEKSHQIYGSPRVYAALKRAGINTSRKRVARLMKKNGLKARGIKTYAKPAKTKLFYKAVENKRKDRANPTTINQLWSGDITYLKVGQHWHYLAVVLDVFSRRIIGWAFGKNKTTELTLKALKTALKNRKTDKTILFHTDRGAEYRAKVVQAFLKKHQIEPSMNRPGHCTDNAEVESFFHSMKGDIIRGNKFRTFNELLKPLKSYLNYFYNRQRLHSSLGYRTPVEFEQAVI